MAENKKSIVVYADWINTFEQLEDDEAGRLIKHFFRYVNDLNPSSPDKLTQIAFEPIKQSLKRDLEKWERIREKRSEAGKKSAELRQQTSTNSTSVKSVEQTSTNSTVSDSVSVSVNVSDSVINKKELLFVRKTKFYDSLTEFVPTYGKQLIREFFDYWTEPNKSETKMKFELQKTWSLPHRLNTWARNDKNFIKPLPTEKDKPIMPKMNLNGHDRN